MKTIIEFRRKILKFLVAVRNIGVEIDLYKFNRMK